MGRNEELERLFLKRGFTDHKWLDPQDIVVAQWVRMKCVFGCDEYGQAACCPPNTPPVAECERFFKEYRLAAVFHFEKRVEKPEDRHAWSRRVNLELLKLEREVFLAGYPKAFLLPMDSCNICPECAGHKSACKEPERARPAAEAMAVDVFTTVRKLGYPIEVLSDTGHVMNRYAFLMID